MEFTDTHAHFYLPEFTELQIGILEEAEKQGVKYILMPAIDSTTHQSMLWAGDVFSQCLPMMGVHPCSIKDNYKQELELAARYLEEMKFVAIGETGLDFYWDLTWKEEQYAAFQQQIEWALHYDLPLVIHSRESMDACIEMVKKNQAGNLIGVFHCFSGSLEQARKIIDLGFYLGIGGVLTYKNSGLDTVIREVDLKHIVLETDAPYLAPVPFRGKKNESKYISIIAQKLAEVKSTTLEEIAAITTGNAYKLFRLAEFPEVREPEL